MSDAKMWYIAVGGQRQGPMGAEDVVKRMQSGSIDSTTLAYASDITENWTPISQIPQFGQAMIASPFMPPVPDDASPSLADEVDYQIFGSDLQFVEVELDPGESVVAEAGSMMYMDHLIEMETIFGDGSANQESGIWGMVKGAGKRLLTGESLFMTVFTHKGGSNKAHVAFAAPYPGKIVVIDLQAVGGTFICQKDSFLCGAKGVSIGIAL